MSEKKVKKIYRQSRTAVVVFWSVILLLALFLFFKKAGLLTCFCWSAFAPYPLIFFVISIFCLLKRKWISGIFLLCTAKFFWLPIFLAQFPDFLPMISREDFVRNYWYILVVIFASLMIIKHLLQKKQYCWEYKVKVDSGKKPAFSTNVENGFIKSNVVFNNINRMYENADFTGGEFNVVFGSQYIDLRKCVIHNNEKAQLELHVVFSNCEIWLPSDWNIEFKMDSVFSSIDDYRQEKPTETSSKNTLILTGSCVFSSLKIKN